MQVGGGLALTEEWSEHHRKPARDQKTHSLATPSPWPHTHTHPLPMDRHRHTHTHTHTHTPGQCRWGLPKAQGPLSLKTLARPPGGATHLLSLLRLSVGCWYCPFILLSLL